MVSRVEIVEVGPRDGFQSIASVIPTAIKISLIQDLYATGLRRIEIGSFVSRGAIPQFADVVEILAGTRSLPGFDPQVLVPTERRADEALAAGADHLVFVLSVSERHNQSNVRRSTAESVEEYRRIVKRSAPATKIRLNIATAFDCPYEGTIAMSTTLGVLDQLIEMAPCAEIGLCDTTGRVMPTHVEELFAACFTRFPTSSSWAFHAHDTYGLGVTNVLAAWRTGVNVIDGSVAGLGGCPFAPGATGNVATEDLVWLFDGIGVGSGVDIERLVAVAKRAQALPGAQPGGRVREALSARGAARIDSVS